MDKKLYLNGNPKSVGFEMDNDKKRRALDRYLLIKKIMSEYDDRNGELMLESIIKDAIEYIEIVVDFETRYFMLKNKYDEKSEDFQKAIVSLDIKRKSVHDSLLSSLQGFNGYLAREYKFEPQGPIPVGGIFSENYSKLVDRKIVGDWAWYLISGLYTIVNK